MHEAGRAIPDSVSVVGFDDTPSSAFYTPSLTTIRQDFAGLGRACFAMLLDRAGSGFRSGPRPSLIVRESSGPPGLPAASLRGDNQSV
jgi:DNA-binding LacI/PurR family transcriptional regulator